MDETDTESERWRLSRYTPPKPTTGRWTVLPDGTGGWAIHDSKGLLSALLSERQARMIADAHNAALANVK